MRRVRERRVCLWLLRYGMIAVCLRCLVVNSGNVLRGAVQARLAMLAWRRLKVSHFSILGFQLSLWRGVGKPYILEIIVVMF